MKDLTPKERFDATKDWPIQLSITNHPVVRDENGTLRYKARRISRWLCDQISLNSMSLAFGREEFSLDEYMQFYREIGFSLGAFSEIFCKELDRIEAEILGRK